MIKILCIIAALTASFIVGYAVHPPVQHTLEYQKSEKDVAAALTSVRNATVSVMNAQNEVVKANLSVEECNDKLVSLGEK